MNERCVTDCGGDAEFIKESFARGMLYSAMSSKIRADVDATKTGGMFFKDSRSMEKYAQSMLLLLSARAV